MRFNNPYWSNRTKIELLQKWILMHSIIYYELNTNIVADVRFDSNSKQLLEYRDNYPNDYKASKYYGIYRDFDGTTGFDLFTRLDGNSQHEYMEEAKWLIELNKRMKENEENGIY